MIHKGFEPGKLPLHRLGAKLILVKQTAELVVVLRAGNFTRSISKFLEKYIWMSKIEKRSLTRYSTVLMIE